MSKFDRKKIAVTLAFASLFSCKTSAMNTNKNGVKSPQSLGAVGGTRNQTSEINWVKIGGISVAVLAALETIHSLIGGFTDSKAGSYSIGRLIRNRVKKNDQHDPGSGRELTTVDPTIGDSVDASTSIQGKGEFYNGNLSIVLDQARKAQEHLKKEWFKTAALLFLINAPQYLTVEKFGSLVNVCNGNSQLQGFRVKLVDSACYFVFLVGNEEYYVHPIIMPSRIRFKVMGPISFGGSSNDAPFVARNVNFDESLSVAFDLILEYQIRD